MSTVAMVMATATRRAATLWSKGRARERGWPGIRRVGKKAKRLPLALLVMPAGVMSRTMMRAQAVTVVAPMTKTRGTLEE